MKALILAAGFGTRLLPYTRTLPKPLFTINNRPILDLTIERLLDIGCQKIFINTHHLGDQIQNYVQSHPHNSRLQVVYEPEILDTGGAIANLSKELGDHNFLVINADIVCDADLMALVHCHESTRALATLLVHDFPRFNRLKIEMENPTGGRVIHFDAPPETGLAFTGIQVISPQIFDHMPPARVFSSIDVYRALCSTGKIKASLAKHLYWQDMGTPDTYGQTSRQWLAGKIFSLAPARFKEIRVSPLDGDGSDRRWFRAVHGHDSLVICDHGICLDHPTDSHSPLGTQPGCLAQLNAFTAIGHHLSGQGICVPGILGHDTISGQVALEDLGRIHLADQVRQQEADAIPLYHQVIDSLIEFSRTGIQGFDPAWTCQTATYSKALILDMECRYFMEAFVKGYLGQKAPRENLAPAFSHIADHALAHGYTGLMHRDMQSKNIMIHKDRVWFIDFQSARKGPLQYDLASLLIDPYVKLPQKVQDELVEFTMDRLGLSSALEKENFNQSFEYCCITRNLQMLGAFGFLTRIKNKPWFEAYIPPALAGLKTRLAAVENNITAPLAAFVNQL